VFLMRAVPSRDPTGGAGVLNVLGTPGDATERARAIIGRQVGHLARLVDDLLDVSRVTTGKTVLTRRAINLGELVTQAMSAWRSSGRLDRHEVSVEVTPVWVNADETRIARMSRSSTSGCPAWTGTKSPA
jgi:signal transduction histidine kinase